MAMRGSPAGAGWRWRQDAGREALARETAMTAADSADAADAARFAIPGVIAIAPGAGGLMRCAITSAQASAELYLHGAHLTGFQPRGHQPLLWMSSASRFAVDAPIRGGIPLCWPWFGAHATRADLPAHGFARLRPWRLTRTAVESDGRVQVVLELTSDAATLALWPHPFRLTLLATVGRELTVELRIDNPGAEALRCEEALHTYLAVGDVGRVAIAGLQGATYLDKVRGLAPFCQDQPLTISAEVDRVFLDTTATVEVGDPAGARTLRVSKNGSSATVVWNPGAHKAAAMTDIGSGEWQRLLCVETANVKAHALTIPPGGHHRTSMTLSATAMGP
jgi:D-hexose-6-phosphate mutarotase